MSRVRIHALFANQPLDNPTLDAICLLLDACEGVQTEIERSGMTTELFVALETLRQAIQHIQMVWVEDRRVG